jgi:hypothetical protein
MKTFLKLLADYGPAILQTWLQVRAEKAATKEPR